MVVEKMVLIHFDYRDDEETPLVDGEVDGDAAAAVAAAPAVAPTKKSVWAPGGSKKSHVKGGAKNKRTVTQKPPKAPSTTTAVSKSESKAQQRGAAEPAIGDSDADSGDESENEEKEGTGGGGGGDVGGGSSDDEKKQVSSVEDDDVEWEKFQQKLNKREKLEGKSKMSHSVHCPNYPEDKQEYWWTYICDRKSRTLLTAPYHVTNLVDAEEIQLKFTAPRWPGVYTFTVCLRSGKKNL